MPAENNGDGTTVDALLNWRSEFPILQETTYLVSNSLGAMPRGVYDSVRAYADTWATRGVRAWGEGWWDMNIQVGNAVAPIIGAVPNTVSMHQNISLAMGTLLSCFDFSGTRNKVVIEGGIFPSVYYVLRGMLPPSAELVIAPGYDGVTLDVQAIVDAIDERTLLVPISQVLFRSAYIVDLSPIIEKAHRVGALVIVDGYHAGGIIPVDFQAMQADIYLGGVLKWMCGGPGGVFMAVRPDHMQTLRPGLTGWQAHKRPFAFETADMDYREDAFRFLSGTPAVPSLYANLPGVEIIAKVGVDAIREKSMRQTAHMITLADQLGYVVNSPRDPAQRGGTVTIDPLHAYEVSKALIARDIVVDYRAGAGIRISPHFYNSDAEVAFAFNQIEDILATGAWENYVTNAQSFVT